MPIDLLAGELREILLALALEDADGLRDDGALEAHLALPAWLDEAALDDFSAAVRHALRDDASRAADAPGAFTAACEPLDAPGWAGERTLDRVDRAWVAAVGAVPDELLEAVATRWSTALAGSADAPDVRLETARIVAFARRAEDAPDVLLGWTL